MLLSPTTTRELDTLNHAYHAFVEDVIHSLAQRPMCCDPKAHLHLVTRPAPIKAHRASARFFVASRGGQIEYASPGLCRWFAASLEAVVGDGWLDFVNGLDEKKRIAAHWLRAGQTHEAFAHTVECRTASGVIMYAIFLVRPRLHQVTHEVIGFIGRVYPQDALVARSA